MTFDEKWKNNYKLALEYYEKHGNLEVPYNYVTENGERLGNFITNQRTAYIGTGTSKFDLERIKMLNDIGMIWDVRLYKLSKKIIDNDSKKKIYKKLDDILFNVLLEVEGSVFYSMDDVYYVNDLFMEALDARQKVK